MPEWRPGVLEALLREIKVTGTVSLRTGMTRIAEAIEAMAKSKLGLTSHSYGTPSPAPSGGPPSLVTGTGRRSIAHQYLSLAGVIEMRIGTAAGVYSRTGSTPSSKYLMYQEKGNHPYTGKPFNHPFLKPSFDQVVTKQVEIWLESFRRWPRI